MKGFDAVIGNPAWVLYAGKGKAPIDSEEEALLKCLFGQAARTLSTHGAFATQAGRLVGPRGRVGLVLPTSMADASRYADSRAGHASLCEVENALPDFGESAFVGVFQPSFGLISTRRDTAQSDAGESWELHRPGVRADVRLLLAKLNALPKLPPELFGERGYRSSQGHDGVKFRKLSTSQAPFTAPLYEGTSVREFELIEPTAFADPDELDEVGKTEKWRSVKVFIRQTAKYPIACYAVPSPFRNSILAGFSSAELPNSFLLAYLNSSPVRWYHFHAQRDAQQGMPQVKIGHLRALPTPVQKIAELTAIGVELGERGTGIAPEERARLDEVAAIALDLSHDERALILKWASDNAPPIGRLRKTREPVEQRVGVDDKRHSA